MSGLGARIDALLAEQRLDVLVRTYFTSTDLDFAGHLFDTVGDNPADAITTGDLLAVSLLDVTFGPSAVQSLLDTSSPLVELLRSVPVGTPLWEADQATLDAAGELWTEVDKLPGVGRTKAGKLLARKRPHLLPIYDSVIAEYLRPEPNTFWEELRAALADGERRASLDALVAGLTPAVPTLRALDVAVWMRCGGSQNAKQVRGDLGLPEEPLHVD